MSEINSFSDYTNKYNSNVDYSALFGGTSNSSSLGSTNILSDYAAIKNGSYRGRVQADWKQRSQRGKALNRKRHKGSVGRKRGRCPYKGTEYACKEAYLSLKETGGED